MAYNGGGKTDWYLPSKDELNELFLKRASVGAFGADWYHSSSEYQWPEGSALKTYNNWQLQFGSAGITEYDDLGSWYGRNKTANYVRPVRAF